MIACSQLFAVLGIVWCLSVALIAVLIWASG